MNSLKNTKTSFFDQKACLRSSARKNTCNWKILNTGTFGLKGHRGLKGHFQKTSILALFGDSLMMGAKSMSSWVIDTMFSQKNMFDHNYYSLGKVNIALAISEPEQMLHYS